MALVVISNPGMVPATHLRLVITTPENVTGSYVSFSTENITSFKKINPRLLEVYMPRFVQGEASITSTSPPIDIGNYLRSLLGSDISLQ